LSYDAKAGRSALIFALTNCQARDSGFDWLSRFFYLVEWVAVKNSQERRQRNDRPEIVQIPLEAHPPIDVHEKLHCVQMVFFEGLCK